MKISNSKLLYKIIVISRRTPIIIIWFKIRRIMPFCKPWIAPGYSYKKTVYNFTNCSPFGGEIFADFLHHWLFANFHDSWNKIHFASFSCCKFQLKKYYYFDWISWVVKRCQYKVMMNKWIKNYLIALQATSPASQLTVIFQMISVVTDSNPTDRSEIDR